MDWQHELFIKITLGDIALLLLFILTVIVLGSVFVKQYYFLRRRETLKKEVQEVIQEEIDSALRGR